MRITISLNGTQLALLDEMMKHDHQTSKSAYFVYLMSQEEKNRNKPRAGRPRKDEDASDDEVPDENAPKILKAPAHLLPWVPYLEQGNLVNEYDILVLEERKKLFPHNAK